jgi:PleD family two-component response regulator
MEMIKQSINEIRFKTPDGEYTNVTISGGFAIKPKNKMLDESINQAKEILRVAKEMGGNKIAQLSDLAKLDI